METAILFAGCGVLGVTVACVFRRRTISEVALIAMWSGILWGAWVRFVLFRR